MRFLFRIPVIILAVNFSLFAKTIIFKDSVIVNCSPRTGELSCHSLKRFISCGDPQVCLKNYLDSLGYFHQKWDTLSTDSIIVQTGKRSIVVSESVSGLDSSLLSRLPSVHYPTSYNAGEINRRMNGIGRFLAENGYPFASIVVNFKNLMLDSLSLSFSIETDQKYLFSKSRIYGSFTTKKRVIQNDILFREGEPYNIKKVEESQRRLRSRFYVADAVDFPPVITSDEQSRSDSNQSRVTVPFRITDRSGLGLEGAAGFETYKSDRPNLYGNLTFSFLNLFHTGEAVSFQYAGDRSKQQLKMDLTKPWFFNLPLTVGAGMELEVVNELYGYLGGQMKFLSETGSNWRIGLGLSAYETTPSQDSTGEFGTFYGADLILSRPHEEYRKGQFGQEFYIETGSGIASKDIKYTRSHFDFMGGIHVPVFQNQAIVTKVISKHLITNEKNLIAAEMYRIGGYNSLRGYPDNEFSLRTVMYGQFEYLLYFKNTGSVYIFSDGGIGFKHEVNLHSPDRQLMMGYGFGVRVPSRVGSLNIEWARNYQERAGLGRIHVSVQNALADVSNKLPFRF